MIITVTVIEVLNLPNISKLVVKSHHFSDKVSMLCDYIMNSYINGLWVHQVKYTNDESGKWKSWSFESPE